MPPPLNKKLIALEGLIQWTEAALEQVNRIGARPRFSTLSFKQRRVASHTLHREIDFFVYAAWKILEYGKWARSLGLCKGVDFTELDKFDTADTRDLRNMREHVVEYFQGAGNNQDRWRKETPELSVWMHRRL